MVGLGVFCRVLIVDDNADLAEATSMLLRHYGFHTVTAYNGRLAIARAHDFRPEVVLLDIGLPDMSGYDVAATIREESDSDSARPLLIAISAQSPDAKKEARDGRPFDYYLVKPVEPDTLLQLVSKLGP
jgi:CheY-like chemotaxis protein